MWKEKHCSLSRSTLLFSFQERNVVGAKFCSTETNIYIHMALYMTHNLYIN